MRRATELSLKIDAGVYGAAGAIFREKTMGIPPRKHTKNYGKSPFFLRLPKNFWGSIDEGIPIWMVYDGKSYKNG
jgi:hypothetical protein